MTSGAGFIDFAGRINGVNTEPLDSRFRGNDIWGAGSRVCGNDKNNDREARRRARRKSERGGRAPRRQGETAQPARRQSKETQSGSAAREGRPTRSRRRSVPAPGAAKQDKARLWRWGKEAEGLWSRGVKQGAANDVGLWKPQVHGAAEETGGFRGPRSKTKAGA